MLDVLTNGFFWASLLLPYFIGAIPFGVLVSKTFGVNIFTTGSGNPGFTNVLRTLGLKVGLFVLLLDMAKGSLGTYLGYYFFGELGMIMGFAGALLGHSFSPFIHFKGGKGIATGAGGLLFISPLTFLLCALTVIIPAYITRYMSVGAILSALLCPLYLYLSKESYFIIGAISPLAVYVVFLHRSNIKRLLCGEENKISIGKRV